MSAFNLTSFDPPEFILKGIPGLEAAHIWISIPFSMFYIISLLGNFTVLFVVVKEETLHKPMYLLFCMLALTDIGISTCVMPKALCIFWLPFCSNRVIPHTYCEHNAVLKMSCGDSRVFQMYSLVLTFMIIGLDLIFIGLSYGPIIRAILRLSSKKAHQKALNTCTAHICVMLMFYTPNLFSTLTHRFGQDIASHIHVLLANLYLLVPPMFNPIIYGVNTREFREK
ncbi:olfactory receptor 52B2-like, partial [Emydura macquarii macquarii]|uniref:olfactory receptor 52B2-like n=1 Tax=Emydura macquarii macquarii TaxID=1129001 RepID=UPI00352A1D8A